MENVNARALCLECLMEVFENDEFSNVVLGNVLTKYQYLQRQQRSYINRAVLVCVERRDEIDYIINTYSKTPVAKMKPAIRNILRLGVCEIFYMDSIPASATVNEMVNLSGKYAPKALRGFVNGVLRNISRSPKPVATDWQTTYSMPEFIIDIIKSVYSAPKTREILEAYLGPSKTAIHVNLNRLSPGELADKLSEVGIDLSPVVMDDRVIGDAFYISGYDYLNSLEAFREGLFYVQDPSAMMVAENIVKNLPAKSGDLRILDLCAAPGGKGLHLASLLCSESISYDMTLCDVSSAKVSLIEENINKSQMPNVKACVSDATVLDEDKKELADIVIADVPCSGLGVIGKKPDIKYHITPESIESLISLQKQIINNAASYVKEGGLLSYSTCTINPAECSGQVDDFLKDNMQFSKVFEKTYLPCENHDGAYICLMRRS